MRYYVFIVTKSDSGEDRQSFGYDTLDAAEAKFHQVLSSAISGSAINYCLVNVIDSNNAIKFKRVWVRATEESED